VAGGLGRRGSRPLQNVVETQLTTVAVDPQSRPEDGHSVTEPYAENGLEGRRSPVRHKMQFRHARHGVPLTNEPQC